MPSDAGSIPAASTNERKGLDRGANPFLISGNQGISGSTPFHSFCCANWVYSYSPN